VSMVFAGQTSSKTNQAPQSNTAIAIKLSEGQKDYCQFLWHCGLPKPNNYCPDSAALGKPNFIYDSARCSEGRELTKRGIGPDNALVGYKLYRFLGMEYRTVYVIDDFIAVSIPKLEYLLNDLPFAARIVSHYQPEVYTAEYVDAEHKYFKGKKGKRLSGEARLISGSFWERRLFYLGQGKAEIAWWKLVGPALMDFTYNMDPKGLHYRMKILVFPGNGMINGIMNLGLFKKIVNGKIHDVLTDLTETARKLAKDQGASIKNDPTWSLDDKLKIDSLLKLP
jgi:hypothetical protein